MGGPGSTGSAEDVVNAAVNATLKNSSRPDPQTCPPRILPQHPPKYLGYLSLLILDPTPPHPQPHHLPAPPVMVRLGNILWS